MLELVNFEINKLYDSNIWSLVSSVIICSLKMCNRLTTCLGFISASLDELLGEAPVPSVTVMIHKTGISLNRKGMDGQTPTQSSWMIKTFFFSH